MKYKCFSVFTIAFLTISPILAMKRQGNELEEQNAKKVKLESPAKQPKINLHDLLMDDRLPDIKKILADKTANFDPNETLICADGVQQSLIHSVFSIIRQERKERKQRCLKSNPNMQRIEQHTAAIQSLYEIGKLVVSNERFNPASIDQNSPALFLAHVCLKNESLDGDEADRFGMANDKLEIDLKKEAYLEYSLNSEILNNSISTINSKGPKGRTALHELAKSHIWNGRVEEAKKKLEPYIHEKSLYLASQMLNAGANPGCTSTQAGKTPLEFCFCAGNDNIFPTRNIPMAILNIIAGGSCNHPDIMQYLGLDQEKGNTLCESFRTEQLSLLQPKGKENIVSTIFSRQQASLPIARQPQLGMHDVRVDFVLKNAPKVIEDAPKLLSDIRFIADENGNEQVQWQLNDDLF